MMKVLHAPRGLNASWLVLTLFRTEPKEVVHNDQKWDEKANECCAHRVIKLKKKNCLQNLPNQTLGDAMKF